MLGKVIPGRLKAYLKRVIRQNVQAFQLKSPYREGFFPHQPQSDCYLLPKIPEKGEYHESSSLPIPPRNLWINYGENAEEWLASGRRDVQVMRGILSQSGASPEPGERILDFGCAAGRMIRWFQDLADTCEIWGTDISSSHIIWCKQYLSPPFHFATTTIYPHLPFEDRYFSLIYSGSVFTHIDDLADAWFLELRRVLRSGGRLYITIHDRHTVDLLEGKAERKESWYLKVRPTHPEYEKFIRSDFGMFTLWRSVHSQVYYDVNFLCRGLEPFFRTIIVKKEAYGHQTGVLLERV